MSTLDGQASIMEGGGIEAGMLCIRDEAADLRDRRQYPALATLRPTPPNWRSESTARFMLAPLAQPRGRT